MTAALAAVRALVDYDEQVLSNVICQQPTQSDTGLAEVVRACAPLITKKSDWAALYMLLTERKSSVSYTDLCRLIAECAPDAPQPKKQDFYSGLWNPKGRFPDWKPTEVRYDKFRRHYLIAQRASEFLFTEA